MKNYKLFFVLLIILMLAPCVCGYAAEETKSAEVSYDTGVITVEGNTGISEKKLINIIILYPNTTLSDLTVDNFGQKVFCVYEMFTENDGSYIFDETFLPTAGVPDEHIGWYTAIISVEGKVQTEAQKSAKFYYADTTARANAISAVNYMTAENAATVFNTHKDTIGITLGADYIAAQVNVCGAMLHLRDLKYQNGGTGYNNLEDIKDDFIEAQWIGNMQKAASVNTETLLKISEEKLVPIIAQDYTKNKEMVWNNFLLLRKNANMVKEDDVQTVFNEAIALCMVNISNREELLTVLENYNTDVLKLDLGSKYREYDLEITKELSSKSTDYQSITEIQTAFNTALENAGKKKPSGGSSGGGSSTSIKIDNEIITPQKQHPVFSDINDAAWAQEYLIRLAEEGILSGYEDNTVRPNKVVTREEFLKMLIEALNLSKSGVTADFTDVSPTAWYTPYINTAVGLGISTGYTDGTFGVGENIKRQDMAVMACRALENANLVFANKITEFPDKDKISEYAAESVKKLASVNIIGGRDDGCFCPGDFATRAEAAKIICGIIDYREEGKR